MMHPTRFANVIGTSLEEDDRGSDEEMSDSNLDPRARADTYRKEEADAQPDARPDKRPARRTPEQWSDLISQRIEEAMRDGQFDNLRGKGRPINPTPEPHIPPEMQMANSLLKNNELVPAWISDRNAVLAAIDATRNKIRRAAADYSVALKSAETAAAREQVEARWQAQLSALREEVRALNRRIELQNFKQPVTFLEIYKLRLDDEVKSMMNEGMTR